MNKALKQEIDERYQALIELDTDYAQRVFPSSSCDYSKLVSLHRVRYEFAAMPDHLRNASAQWLEQRGYPRLDGSHEFPLINTGQDEHAPTIH